MRSVSLKKLLPALASAKSEMNNPKKGKINPAFKSGYVDLVTLLACIEEPLAAHGLQLIPTLTCHDGNLDCLVTTLFHNESEEFISSVHPLRPSKPDPQGFGSALTYARRYSIMALLNLGAEDDDGNAASGRPTGSDTIADKMRAKGSGFTRPTTKE